MSAAPRAGSTTAAWSGLRPVTLAQLDIRAPLLRRQDRKYLLPACELPSLARALGDSHEVLQIDGERTFRYDSAYVDSADLVLYRDHVQGRRLRWKARTRRYGGGPLCFQEIKLKEARGATVKLRQRCAVDEHGWVGRGFTAFVDDALRTHYGEGLQLELRPSLSVRYSRSTLVSVDGRERLTVDSDLEYLDRDGRLTGGLRPDVVLVEVKTPHGHGPTDRVLARQGRRSVSVSKYGAGVALTHPEIGQSRLRAVLRTGFRRVTD